MINRSFSILAVVLASLTGCAASPKASVATQKADGPSQATITAIAGELVQQRGHRNDPSGTVGSTRLVTAHDVYRACNVMYDDCMEHPFDYRVCPVTEADCFRLGRIAEEECIRNRQPSEMCAVMPPLLSIPESALQTLPFPHGIGATPENAGAVPVPLR